MRRILTVVLGIWLVGCAAEAGDPVSVDLTAQAVAAKPPPVTQVLAVQDVGQAVEADGTTPAGAGGEKGADAPPEPGQSDPKPPPVPLHEGDLRKPFLGR